MPTIFRDRLYRDGEMYPIDFYALDPWRGFLPARPLGRPTPFRQNGYVAAWAVLDEALCLVETAGDTIAPLFAHREQPVPATWFSGCIRGWRGHRRETGYPPRTFHDDEIVLEIVAGMVTRLGAGPAPGTGSNRRETAVVSATFFVAAPATRPLSALYAFLTDAGGIHRLQRVGVVFLDLEE